jgi:hypothetical protein
MGLVKVTLHLLHSPVVQGDLRQEPRQEYGGLLRQ